MRYYKILIFSILAISSIIAQDIIVPDSLYKNGNNAMLQEDFATAITSYESLVEQGYAHADLYYNLGNAYYRLNQIGNAVWAYEKGLQLAPRDRDLLFNLSLVNNRLQDRIDVPQSSAILEQYRALKKSTTLSDIILIAAAIMMLAAFLYFLKKYYRWESIWISRSIIALFMLSLLVHLVALDKYYALSETRELVIVEQEVELFSAPFEKRETVIFRLHEGVKAEIVQQQDNWLELMLIDGKKGWLRLDKVREL